MGALLSSLYGVVVYVFFLGTFLYAIGFVGNVLRAEVDRHGSGGAARRGAGREPAAARALRRAAQRHGAARRSSAGGRASCRRRWSAAPTCSPRGSRSRCCSGSGGRFGAGDLGRRGHRRPRTLLRAVFWLGWAVLLLEHLPHQPLRAVRPAPGVLRLAGREIPEPEFRTPLLYRYVRHPIYLGFLLGFWAAPAMTAGHCCSRSRPPATS